MNRILVVVAPTETDIELLEEAGAIAAAADVEVVVLALTIEGDEHASLEAMRRWQGFEDTSNDGTDTSRRFANHLGAQVLAPLGVEYLSVGEPVESMRPSSMIIEVAENHGCDHVFVTNRGRSPAGKALFGDTAQSVILNFDGFVTVRSA